MISAQHFKQTVAAKHENIHDEKLEIRNNEDAALKVNQYYNENDAFYEFLSNIDRSNVSFPRGAQHNPYAGLSYCGVSPTIEKHNWLNNNKTRTPWESLRFYTSIFLRRTAVTYLSSPILLASLPLLVGLLIGWFVGRRQHRMVNRSQHKLLGKNTRARSGSSVAPLITPSLPGKNDNASNKANSSPRKKNLTSLVLSFLKEQSKHDDSNRNKILQEESEETIYESGVHPSKVPRHIAVIMDGNRRYGKKRYGFATKGHWDGSKKLVDFAQWCQSEGIQILSVYAFSTENWNRDPSEVIALMKIFAKYCEEIRVQALKRGIRVRVLSTETHQIPNDVKLGIKKLTEDTAHCDSFIMNICLSYGGRGEILNACKSIVADVEQKKIRARDVTEAEMGKRMLTSHCDVDPDLVIRTSGEMRISNFLLWQIAYSEIYFLDMQWPEITKKDLMQVIQNYAQERERRYGK